MGNETNRPDCRRSPQRSIDVREADTRLAIISSVLFLVVMIIDEGDISSDDGSETDDILILPWGGEVTLTGAVRRLNEVSGDTNEDDSNSC